MLDLEEIDKDLYRSKKLWLPSGARGVFGNSKFSFFFFETLRSPLTLPTHP